MIHISNVVKAPITAFMHRSEKHVKEYREAVHTCKQAGSAYLGETPMSTCVYSTPQAVFEDIQGLLDPNAWGDAKRWGSLHEMTLRDRCPPVEVA